MVSLILSLKQSTTTTAQNNTSLSLCNVRISRRDLGGQKRGGEIEGNGKPKSTSGSGGAS